MKNILLRAGLIIVALGLIIWCVVAAVDFRKNLPEFVPTDEAMRDYTMSQSMPTVFINPGEDPTTEVAPLPTAEDIIADSEVIVKVTPTGHRELLSLSLLTEVTVDEVLKSGRNIATGDTLLIHEWVNISTIAGNEDIHGHYVAITGNNNIMQSDRSYIACLDFYEQPEGYKYSEDELRIYVFANQHFGLFPVERPEDYALILPAGEGEEVTYSEIQPYDVLAGSEKEFQDYLTLWDGFNERLGRAG